MIAPVLTLDLLYENFYRRAKHLTASPGTIEQYRNTVKIFCSYMTEGYDVSGLRTEHIDGFKEWRLLTVKPATLNRDLRHLRALVKWARKPTRKYIKRRIEIEMVKAVLADPQAWSIDELSAILLSAAKEKGTIEGIPAAMWWRAMLLALVNTASRITALMELKIANWTSETGLLIRRAETQKQNKTQSDTLVAAVRQALEDLIAVAPDREMLFPWPFDLPKLVKGTNKFKRSWRTLWKRYRRILCRAGLPATRGDLFHRLRKTTITHITVASNIATACEMAGHSSEKVTQRYIDPRMISKPATGNMLDWNGILDGNRQQLLFNKD